MSGSATVFLAVIAVATLVMALIQLGVVVYAARLGRRVERLGEQVESGLQPLLAHVEAVGANAAEASRLVVGQVARADRALGDLATRMERTWSAVQTALDVRLREGRALMIGLRAGLAAFRDLRQEARSRSSRTEEEDSLFIG